MGPIDCPETSVRNYDYSLRNDPEERRYQLLNSFDNISKLSIFLFVMEMESFLCEKSFVDADKETDKNVLPSVCLSVCPSRPLHTLHSLHITKHERATATLFLFISFYAIYFAEC
jgi:hypothetical protein